MRHGSLLLPNNDERQRSRRQPNGRRRKKTRLAGAEKEERVGERGVLTPRRRAGDAVGDPRELVLDGVRREVVLLRRGPAAPASSSSPGHPAAPPRSHRTGGTAPCFPQQCETEEGSGGGGGGGGVVREWCGGGAGASSREYCSGGTGSEEGRGCVTCEREGGGGVEVE
jgi:hypothetical protein